MNYHTTIVHEYGHTTQKEPDREPQYFVHSATLDIEFQVSDDEIVDIVDLSLISVLDAPSETWIPENTALILNDFDPADHRDHFLAVAQDWGVPEEEDRNIEFFDEYDDTAGDNSDLDALRDSFQVYSPLEEGEYE